MAAGRVAFTTTSPTHRQYPAHPPAPVTDGAKGQVVAKMENFNPLWSVKDRIGVAMIDAAEKAGKITKDTIIIEPDIGQHRHRPRVHPAPPAGITHGHDAREHEHRTPPPAQSVRAPRSFLTAPKRADGAIAKANELIEQYKPNRSCRSSSRIPANPEIHRKTTAEKFERHGRQSRTFSSPASHWRTITGVSEVLKKRKPSIKSIAVEPVLSPVIHAKTAGQRSRRAGIRFKASGAASCPAYSISIIIDEVVQVQARIRSRWPRRLAREEGLLVGISAGPAAFRVRFKWPNGRERG